MDCDILVDGYNVIKKNVQFQSLELRNFGLARDVLVRQLKNRYRSSTARVIVVFDGNDVREQVRHDEHICIMFSRHGETADRVIARLAAEGRAAGREIVLYSDDGEVRYNVVEQGGKVQSTRQLTTRLNAAPADMVARVEHRQKMRRMYGLDPWYKAEDYEDFVVQKGKKHKKSARRRRR